jgi:hypothetical protein
MDKYQVQTEVENSKELLTLEEAIKIFEDWKDGMMSEGVIADETYIQIVKSIDDFEDHEIIQKVIAVIDEDRHELRTPREEGMDWDYWAKWENV